jgi:carboxyl-terminal processing protease
MSKGPYFICRFTARFAPALLAWALIGGSALAEGTGCQGKSILEDNFSNASGGWALGPNVKIEHSTLVIQPEPRQTQDTLNVTHTVSEADICADVTFPRTPVGVAAGLIVWATDYKNFYSLQVQPNGDLSIWRLQNNKWFALRAISVDRGVRQGRDRINELEVKASGNSLTFLINGSAIRTISASPPTSPWHFGVYGQNGTVVFKQFKVASIEASPPNPLARLSKPSDEPYSSLNLFGTVFERVRTDYVVKPSAWKLIDNAIGGMMKAADVPVSTIDEKKLCADQLARRDAYSALLCFGSAFEKTKQSAQKLTDKDLIEAAVTGMVGGLDPHSWYIDPSHAVTQDPVALSLMQLRTSSKVPVTARPIGDPIAYIRIKEFNQQTFDKVKRAINNLNTNFGAKNIQGYVLDLRSDPGGLFSEAISVANAFLKNGEIVITRGRNPSDTQRFDAKPNGDLIGNKPLVVLIDGNTAGLGEIVAASLQDNKRATIIGTRSFGYATIQTVIPLGVGNGAIRLTTAFWYPPSGRLIQARGIAPDIIVHEEPSDTSKDEPQTNCEASLPNHLQPPGPSVQEPCSPYYMPPNARDDKALRLAIDLLHGVVKNRAFPPDRTKPLPN